MAAPLACYAEGTLAQEAAPRIFVSGAVHMNEYLTSIACRRNMINILLFIAEHCRRYFPSSEIPNMLSTFIPLITKDVCFEPVTGALSNVLCSQS